MVKSTKKSEIERKWHLVDAEGQILGRLASRITPLLLGKCKSYFVRNLDCGDHVVVINAKQVVVTGRKEQQKKYYSYSGYPGGLKVSLLAELREKFPERIIEKAVYNMLPKNKLRSERMKRLHVFANQQHPYEDKFKTSSKKEEKK
ncbi:MAG TPA: 50S ribosomal protein L13 [Clostridia bacterium]|nr:50S ribosomal protein L13 [Clostridia bacterium]